MAEEEVEAENGDEERPPMVFISHRSADKNIAKAVASSIEGLSDSIAVHLSSDPTYEGPRVGKSINQQLKEALGSTSLVILVFTEADQDWSYCMWECGVATDPNDNTPTSVVTLSIFGDAPKMYEETLIVRAEDSDSVKNFVMQLATQENFLPGKGKLTKWSPEADAIKDRSEQLFDALEPFTKRDQPETKERWGGFTVSLSDELLEKLADKESTMPDDSEVEKVMEAAVISNAKGWGLSHFGFNDLEDGMTLKSLRVRWENERGEDRIGNRPWSEVIVEELWRISSNRRTNLRWEPFKSLREGDLWVYPVVYQYTKIGTQRIDFDVLIVQTLSPESEEA